jgi:hypothetical protein
MRSLPVTVATDPAADGDGHSFMFVWDNAVNVELCLTDSKFAGELPHVGERIIMEGDTMVFKDPAIPPDRPYFCMREFRYPG